MSFTYSVNTDGTVSNVQFNTTDHLGFNITCAEVVHDDLQDLQHLDALKRQQDLEWSLGWES